MPDRRKCVVPFRPSHSRISRDYGTDHFWFLPPFFGWALTALTQFSQVPGLL
jgi:hypothetical protein